MQKRIFAILALALFAVGLAVFGYSLTAGTNDYTYFALIFCAPGAVMALLNTMGQNRAKYDEMIERKEEEDEKAI